MPAAAHHEECGVSAGFDQFGRRGTADYGLSNLHGGIRSERFAESLSQGVPCGSFKCLEVGRNVASVDLREIPASHSMDSRVECGRQPGRQTQGLRLRPLS